MQSDTLQFLVTVSLLEFTWINIWVIFIRLYPGGKMIRHLSLNVEEIIHHALWCAISCVILPLPASLLVGLFKSLTVYSGFKTSVIRSFGMFPDCFNFTVTRVLVVQARCRSTMNSLKILLTRCQNRWKEKAGLETKQAGWIRWVSTSDVF